MTDLLRLEKEINSARSVMFSARVKLNVAMQEYKSARKALGSIDTSVPSSRILIMSAFRKAHALRKAAMTRMFHLEVCLQTTEDLKAKYTKQVSRATAGLT